MGAPCASASKVGCIRPQPEALLQARAHLANKVHLTRLRSRVSVELEEESQAYTGLSPSESWKTRTLFCSISHLQPSSS